MEIVNTNTLGPVRLIQALALLNDGGRFGTLGVGLEFDDVSPIGGWFPDGSGELACSPNSTASGANWSIASRIWRSIPCSAQAGRPARSPAAW